MARSVSVIIPTYNGAEFLGAALESVFAQTLLPSEVIVVDDASTDRTPALVTGIARQAPVPVRLIRFTQNSGSPARPINAALRVASGDYIAVCDQDDVFCPEKLQYQVAVFDQNPEIVCVASMTGLLGKPEEILQPHELLQEIQAAGQRKNGFIQVQGSLARRMLLQHGNFILGYPGFLFRPREWKRKGGINESFRIGSDFDFLFWLSTQGPLAFIERVHYLRRLHAGNLTKKGLLTWIETTIVKGQILIKEPRLLDEIELPQELRDTFYAAGYKAREAGFYGKAWRCHWLSLSLWGLEFRTFKALVKLLLYWAYPSWLSGSSAFRVNQPGKASADRS